MRVKEGLIPVILGSAVTATGVAMRTVDMKNHGTNKRDTKVALGAGLIGLGLAHLALGAIDLVNHRD